MPVIRLIYAVLIILALIAGYKFIRWVVRGVANGIARKRARATQRRKQRLEKKHVREAQNASNGADTLAVPETPTAPSRSIPKDKLVAPDTIIPYPTMDGPVSRVVDNGSPRRDRKWFGRNMRYWQIPTDILKDIKQIHGEPGVGLNDSQFSGWAIKAGQVGECNLAKLMVASGIMDDGAQTFWSLSLPNAGRYSGVDVDCIVTYGNVVYLVDAKNYTVKDGTMYTRADDDSLHIVDANTGQAVPNTTHRISASMIMAMDHYRNYLPAFVKLVPVVVLCPSTDGTPAVQRATVLKSGQLPVMGAMDFITALREESKGIPADPAIVNMLMPYLKGDSSNRHEETMDAKQVTEQYIGSATHPVDRFEGVIDTGAVPQSSTNPSPGAVPVPTPSPAPIGPDTTRQPVSVAMRPLAAASPSVHLTPAPVINYDD